MNEVEYRAMAQMEPTYWWFLAKRKFVHSLWMKYIKFSQPVILDLGCGTGGMSLFLRQFGSVTGVEKNPVAAKLSQNKIKSVIESDITQLPFPDEVVDVITLFDVLYHQEVHENTVLKESFRILKPGGYIIITDSADQRLWSAHDLSMHAKKRYTVLEVEQFLQENGYSIIYSNYLYAFLYPLTYMIRKFFTPAKKENSSVIPDISLIMNTILFLICEIEAIFTPRVRFPWGSSLCIIAKKPR